MSSHTEWNLFKQSAEYAENQGLSGGVITILRSGLIFENIRRMFLLSIWVTGTMYARIFVYLNRYQVIADKQRK